MFILSTASCAAEINSSLLWQGGWWDSPTVSVRGTRVSRLMVAFGVSARASLPAKTEINNNSMSCTMARTLFIVHARLSETRCKLVRVSILVSRSQALTRKAGESRVTLAY